MATRRMASTCAGVYPVRSNWKPGGCGWLLATLNVGWGFGVGFKFVTGFAGSGGCIVRPEGVRFSITTLSPSLGRLLFFDRVFAIMSWACELVTYLLGLCWPEKQNSQVGLSLSSKNPLLLAPNDKPLSLSTVAAIFPGCLRTVG